jgi:hypothetical protein
VTALSLVQDAAYPQGAALQPGVIVSAGYIGGDALNVWDAADWAYWGTTYCVPIWVRSDPTSVDPTADGQACLAALQALGAPAPYLVLPYGSTSTLFQNPQVDGYWPAYYQTPPVAELYDAAGVVATQYESTDSYDLSVILQSVPTWNTQAGTGPTAVMLDLETAVDPTWVTQFATIVKGAGVSTPNVPVQDGWAWCPKCQGLFYGPNESTSVCPAGGTHSASQSYGYWVMSNGVVGVTTTQSTMQVQTLSGPVEVDGSRGETAAHA